MKGREVCLALFCIFIAPSCHQNNPLGPYDIHAEIIPLSVGNSWEYDGIAYDTTGSVLEQYVEIHEVPRDTLVFGRQFYLYLGYCADTDSGMIRAVPLQDRLQLKLIYKYPTSAGEQYLSEQTNCTVASLDTLISVAAGSFHCIWYRFTTYGMNYRDEYISPGVGLIKGISYYVSGPVANIGNVMDQVELKTYLLY